MATAHPNITPNNIAANWASDGIGTMAAPTIWQKEFDVFEQNADFWHKYEGGGDAFINTGISALTSAGNGHKVKIRVKSGLYQEPRRADEVFSDETHFEQIRFDDYELELDVIRHAVMTNERAEEVHGIRNQIVSGIPGMLGDWLGRRKTEELDMMFVHESTNIAYPNSKVLDTLVAGDGLSYNAIATGAAALRQLGGRHGHAGTINGRPYMALTLVTTDAALTVLKQDSAYQTLVREAGLRGNRNWIWTGEVSDLDGVAVLGRDIINHDGEGPIGSPMNPRASLGNSQASWGTGVLGGGNATSGANTKVNWFKYFPGFAYKFSDGHSLAGGGTHYCLVINPPNAATDPNKIGMFSYTTNDGNKLTGVTQLTAGTMGGVTWDTGVWSGVHTATHAAGAYVIPCNRKGEPFGHSFILGQSAALRGYGKTRMKWGSESYEDDFLSQTFIRAYFGQKIRQDRLGRQPGILRLTHALHYKDLPLPTVV